MTPTMALLCNVLYYYTFTKIPSKLNWTPFQWSSKWQATFLMAFKHLTFLTFTLTPYVSIVYSTTICIIDDEKNCLQSVDDLFSRDWLIFSPQKKESRVYTSHMLSHAIRMQESILMPHLLIQNSEWWMVPSIDPIEWPKNGSNKIANTISFMWLSASTLWNSKHHTLLNFVIIAYLTGYLGTIFFSFIY